MKTILIVSGDSFIGSNFKKIIRTYIISELYLKKCENQKKFIYIDFLK